MRALTPENVVDYLRESGHLVQTATAEAELLAWGVSNVVFRIRTDAGQEFVVKQSRERLRTETPWFSRLDRIWREADLMRVLSGLLPPGVVPAVLFEDRAQYVFAMEAVDADHRVWKADLLDGCIDGAIAAQSGDYLSCIHSATAHDAELANRWSDREVFRELRVDPFYRHVARAHPELQPSIDGLVEEMWGITACMVHADFSPKNILVHRKGISLVDFETGHFGDPAFDLGFFLSHLLLKTVLHAERSPEMFALTEEFWTHYRQGWEPARQTGPLRFDDLERRTVRHLAACMLSRIDGTSRIDYLPQSRQQELVRIYCRRLLHDPPARLHEAFEILQNLLPASDAANR